MEKAIPPWIVAVVLAANSSFAAEVESLRTPGGTQLHHVQIEDAVDASIRLHWPSRWLRDPGLNPVVPELAVQSIQSGGAGGIDREQKADAFVALEALASITADATSVQAEIRIPEGNLDELAVLINTVLTSPHFALGRLEEIKRNLAAIAEGLRESPQGISNRLTFSLLYGDHPVGRYGLVDGDTVRRAERRDVLDFHAETLTRRDATAVVAGSFDIARAAELIDTMLGNLPEGGGAESAPLRFPVPGLTVVLRTPAAEQAWLTMIGPLADGSSSDELSDQIAWLMLGSGPGSELNSALRSELGREVNFGALGVPTLALSRLLQISGVVGAEDLPRTLSTSRRVYARFLAEGPMNSIAPWQNFLAQDVERSRNDVQVNTMYVQRDLLFGRSTDSTPNWDEILAMVNQDSLTNRVRAAFPALDELLTIIVAPTGYEIEGACVIDAVDEVAACLEQGE